MKRAPHTRPGQWFVGAALLSMFTGVQASDLSSVYRQAVESDPQFRAAGAAYQAAQEAKPQAQSLLLPTASASASLSETRNDPMKPAGSVDTYSSKGLSLSLSQPLYHQDYRIQLRQADSEIAKAEAEYKAADQALIARVAEQYFNVLAARDALAFARAEKSAVSRQLEQARKRFNVGLLAITDVHEAQARYDQTVAAEISAVNALDVSREALREIIGKDPGTLDPLQEDIALVSPEPADIDSWIKAGLEQNLSLAAARFGAETAREEIERIRSGHMPTLDLVAGHSYSDTGGGSLGGRESQDTSLSLQFNLPLYQGGRITSQTRQAQLNFEQAQEGVEQQRRATVRQVRAGYLSVMADISRVKALQQSVVSAQSALEATRAGFEVGTRTIVDVLAGESNLYLAQRDYARARYDYILNTLSLKQAAGQLSASDLDQVSGWLVK